VPTQFPSQVSSGPLGGTNHTMRIAYYIVGLILLSSVENCSEGPINGGGTPQLFPLHVGNYWEYQVQHFNPAGVIHDSMTMTQRIVRDTNIDGQIFYAVTHYIARPTSDTLWVFNGSDGFYGNTEPTVLFSELLYKYPTSQNDLSISGLDTFRVISLLQNEDSPSGRFSCIDYQELVRSSLGPGYENDYLSPGIGIIKIETGTINGLEYRASIRATLSQFKLY